MSILSISNLHAQIAGKEILKGISLTVNSGEIHVLMGPNGSGKSTLSYALMGHPLYEVSANKKSKIAIDGKSITDLPPNERARRGLFLAFQNPLTIQGVPIASFLRTAYQAITPSKEKFSIGDFNKMLVEKAQNLGLTREFLRRSLNDGFSGGEKKKAEMLQAIVLQPKFAIFDEIDTGLDIDALKVVGQGIGELVKAGAGVIIITHYQRILRYVKPDMVHILKDGIIVKSGGYDLAKQIEKEGYASINSNFKAPARNATQSVAGGQISNKVQNAESKI